MYDEQGAGHPLTLTTLGTPSMKLWQVREAHGDPSSLQPVDFIIVIVKLYGDALHLLQYLWLLCTVHNLSIVCFLCPDCVSYRTSDFP